MDGLASGRAAVGASATARRITVDGVALAVDDQGRGPAVVCLHAIGHGASDFAGVQAALAARHRVLALDWPGQGRSGDDGHPASARRYAVLLAGVLDAAGVESAIVLGNSIGGAAALHLAVAQPARVRALVLENPGGLAPTDDRIARTALGLMQAFFAAGARRARWFPAAFAAYYRTCVLQRAAAAAQRRRIVAQGWAIAPVLWQAWSGFGDPREDLRDVGPRVACPVLFAWAARDNFVQLRRSLPAIRRFRDVRVERFPAGHAPHLETPAAFLQALGRFIDQVEARPERSALPA